MNKAEPKLTLFIIFLAAFLLVGAGPSLKAYSKTPQPQWSRIYPRSVNYSVNGYPVTVGGDEGRSVVQTTDGGFAIVADINDHHYEPHTGGVDNHTTLVIKTDSTGNMEWEKGYLLSYPRSIFETEDSGFGICGNKFILKLDANGNEQWSKNFPNSYFFTAIQASDRVYVLSGITDSNYDNIANIIKIDVNGNLLWNKTYRESSDYAYSSALSIVETEQGDFAVAGQQGSAWFGVVDAEGNLKVSKVFPELDGAFTSIAETDDGCFVLVGGNQIGGINMPSKGIIAKVDSQGNLLWSHTYNNPPNVGFWFLSVAQTTDGGYVTSGYSSALFKTDGYGDLQWYLSSSNDVSDVLGTTNSVIATEDGGFAVVGSKSNSVWLAK
ncbi:MAG: hypothetical protein QXD70_05930, partial [Candidatus Bathyarchaeia archaeon]